MRGLWPLLIPTFVAGFGVAWWLKPDPPPVESEVLRPKVVPRPPGADSGLRESVLTHDTTLDALGDLRFDEEFEEELAAIDPAEVPVLLAALSERAGYFGLGSRDEEVLGKLLLHWYDADPDAALVWVLARASAADRERLLDQLINHEAGRDLDRAIALANRYLRVADGAVNISGRMLKEAVDQGPEKLLEVLRLGVGRSRESSGSDMAYPAAFDFHRVLDGLSELSKSLEEDEAITTVPTNLVEEWARRDPQAAFEWVSQGHEVPHNGMEDFIEGYAELVGDRELGELVGKLFEPDEADASRGYQLVWDSLMKAPRPEAVEGFLEAARGPATREQHLAALLDRSSGDSGSSFSATRNAIIGAMTPEQRLSLIPRSRLHAGQRQGLTPYLHQLGHTEEEIAAMTGAADE